MRNIHDGGFDTVAFVIETFNGPELILRDFSLKWAEAVGFEFELFTHADGAPLGEWVPVPAPADLAISYEQCCEVNIEEVYERINKLIRGEQ